MQTDLALRWRDTRGSYRPAAETIRTAEYEVAQILADGPMKAFVLQHHYSGTYPAARFRFALLHRGELAGVAIFSHPSNDAVLTSVFPGEATASVELGRFVLLDSVPGNGETWFLARCFEQLRNEGLQGVVSYSDPSSRAAVDGSTVFAGHIGGIYQAHNAAYVGRAKARTLRLLPDGRAFNERTASKIKKQDRGWEYAVAQLVSQGAEAFTDREPPAQWLARQLATMTRPLKHPGNHKYVWGLSRAARRHVETLPHLPYPKMLRAA